MKNNEKHESIDIEKYVNALEKALKEAPLHKDDTVDISDLWVITSLPTDLIIECIKREEFKIPTNIKKITDRKRIILRNKNYLPPDVTDNSKKDGEE